MPFATSILPPTRSGPPSVIAMTTGLRGAI